MDQYPCNANFGCLIYWEGSILTFQTFDTNIKKCLLFEISHYLCYINDRVMANKEIIKHLKEHFNGKVYFTRKEIFDFYNEIEQLKETTFRWRLFNLKENKIIRSLTNDVFTFDLLPQYYPQVSNENKELVNLLLAQFRDVNLSIWSTQVLNEFMLHLPGKSITILEVEKDALEPVFHYLQDLNKVDVFLEPTTREIALYINEKVNVIILKKLITKSPIQTIDDVPTVTLEKLIVDIYSEKKLFEAFQGNELLHIINNAIEKYAINTKTLLNYANRRSKREEIEVYLREKTDLPKIIFDD